MTTRTETASFEGLSLTLKELGGVFSYPIATFLTFENLGLPKAKIACLGYIRNKRTCKFHSLQSKNFTKTKKSGNCYSLFK